VIKFLVGENVPSAEIHHRLQQQYGEECLRRRISLDDMHIISKIHENPSSEKRVVTDRRRERHEEAISHVSQLYEPA